MSLSDRRGTVLRYFFHKVLSHTYLPCAQLADSLGITKEAWEASHSDFVGDFGDPHSSFGAQDGEMDSRSM